MVHTFASFFIPPSSLVEIKQMDYSVHMSTKRALFDLKLIGQAWSHGLKAWAAGLSIAAGVVVKVGEESLSLSLIHP